MAVYEVDVLGRAERTLRTALDDVVDEWETRPGTVTCRLADQSALIAVMSRLHDLGVAVEEVRHLPESPSR